MFIFVLPVSGGGFVNQLAILSQLTVAGFTPTITLSSSGGNVSAYIASAAKWKWNEIERISKTISQDFFISPRCSVEYISFLFGFFEGNLYAKGNGTKEFLENFFDSSTITKDEIWTGTYNKCTQKARLFCNRRKEDSILNTECIDTDLIQCMTSVYCNGDIESIAQTAVASFSIPGYVPAETIDTYQYVDGGVAGASPLTILRQPLLSYAEENSEKVHIIYINSVNLSQPDRRDIRNVVDTWRQATSDLVRTQTVIDRLSAYELLLCNGRDVEKREFSCNYQNLLNIKEAQKVIHASLLEIYPTSSNEINITHFNGEDVVEHIHRMSGKLFCRFWWIKSVDHDATKLIYACE